jgi:hypothetical protein
MTTILSAANLMKTKELVLIDRALLCELLDEYEGSETERLADHNLGLFPEQCELIRKVREILEPPSYLLLP